jgi:hypothetical protein
MDNTHEITISKDGQPHVSLIFRDVSRAVAEQEALRMLDALKFVYPESVRWTIW